VCFYWKRALAGREGLQLVKIAQIGQRDDAAFRFRNAKNINDQVS
jgi:hypothetical protein